MANLPAPSTLAETVREFWDSLACNTTVTVVLVSATPCTRMPFSAMRLLTAGTPVPLGSLNALLKA